MKKLLHTLHKMSIGVGISTLILSLGGCAYNTGNDQVKLVGNARNTQGIKVLDLHSAKKGELFQAQATLKNSDEYSNAQIYYRCVYFDNQQFKIDTGGEWIPVLIYANQEEQVKCTTTNPEVASFKVELSIASEANKVN